MQVKFKGYKEKNKINIKMIIPTGEQKNSNHNGDARGWRLEGRYGML